MSASFALAKCAYRARHSAWRLAYSQRIQRGRVVSVLGSQFGSPGFESHSSHMLDLLSVVSSLDHRPHL